MSQRVLSDEPPCGGRLDGGRFLDSQRGKKCDSNSARNILSFRAHQDNPWRFLYNEGIEPSNNVTERALIGAVMYRKHSFGTQSESECHVVEQTFRIIETCRLQKRNAYEELIDATTAKISSKPATNLLDP